LNIHQHIIEGIKEQLFLNDYLVLPNFGGFVLKSKSSSFGISSQILMPPSKTVGFNIQLKQNDGILNNWLQKKLNCSKQDSTQHLSDFANFCNGVLQSKRRLSLTGIGFFYLDFENNICFEPAHDVNFNTESFGLSALQIKPIEEEIQNEKITERPIQTRDRILTEEAIVAAKPKSKFNYKRTVYLSVFVLTLSTFLIFLVNNLNVKGVLTAALYNQSSQGTYVVIPYPEFKLETPEQQSASFVADNNGIALFNLNKNKSIAVNVFENTTVNTSDNHSSINQSKYEIILGCFKKIKNAKRLVAQLKKKNIKAVIKEKSYKGMHVVSVLGINDKIEAINQLENIQANYPKAWLKVN